MANYSLKQGYEIVKNAHYGSEELRTFVKACPNVSMLFKGLSSVDELKILFEAIPEHITCLRLEKNLCGKSTEETLPADIIEDAAIPCDEEVEAKKTSAEEDFKEEETKPVKASKKEAKKAPKEGPSNKEIYEFLKAKGELKKCKKEFGDTKVASFTAYFAKYYPNGIDGAAEVKEEKPVEPTEVKAEEIKEVKTEEPSEVDYESMSPLQLFNECKKNGIKAKVKQTKEYYISLLVPKKEEVAEDDEWDVEDAKPTEEGPEKFEDDELPEVTPKKKASKKSDEVKPEVKKEAEDDDEDWDI